jgi:hypothetical protein
LHGVQVFEVAGGLVVDPGADIVVDEGVGPSWISSGLLMYSAIRSALPTGVVGSTVAKRTRIKINNCAR